MSTEKLQPTPLGAIFGMPDAAPLYVVHGRIKKVFAKKTGTIGKGQNIGKPWALQTIVLTEGQTEIEVQLKDHEEDVSKAWEGRTIRLSAYKGDKGWSGLYTMDDEFRGKTTRKIKVTATGDIALLDGDGNPEPPARQGEPPRQQQRAEGPPAQNPPPADLPPKPKLPAGEKPPERTPEQHEKASLREAKRTAYQMANLQLLALNMTEQYTAPRFKERTGRGLDAQEKHAWAMNLAIEMTRQGMLSRMPSHALRDDEEPPTQPLQPSDNDGAA